MITIEQILEWNPCEEYDTREKIIALVGDDCPRTPLQVANLDNVLIADRLWLLLRPEIIEEKQLHLLACDFAERVLPIYENYYLGDNRPRKAIETKRRWVEGKASDEELVAARAEVGAAVGKTVGTVAQVWEAARTASWVTSGVADGEVAREVAGTAVRASAWEAEQGWQLERVIEVLKQQEKKGQMKNESRNNNNG